MEANNFRPVPSMWVSFWFPLESRHLDSTMSRTLLTFSLYSLGSLVLSLKKKSLLRIAYMTMPIENMSAR